MNRVWISASILVLAAVTALSSTALGLSALGVTVDANVAADVSLGADAAVAADADAGGALSASLEPILSVDGLDANLLGTEIIRLGAMPSDPGDGDASGHGTGDTSASLHGTTAAAADASAHAVEGGDVVAPLLALGLVLAVSKGLATSVALGMPGLGLFSRLARSDILEHPVRARIHELISANPGINMQTLSREAGIGWGNTVYHLRRMLDAGLVASVKVVGNRAFYLAGAERAAKTDAARTMARSQSEPISRFILTNPGTNQKDIAQSLDLSKAVVSKRIKHLADSGLVSVDRKGRETVLHPTGDLATILGASDFPAPSPAAQAVAAASIEAPLAA